MYDEVKGIIANKLTLEKYRELKENQELGYDEIYTLTDIDEYVHIYKESLDMNNPIILRNLETGVYKLYGYYTYCSTCTDVLVADPFVFALIEKISGYSYVTIVSNNDIKKRYIVTDNDYSTTFEEFTPKFKLISRSTIDVNEYVDVSSYMEQYDELMIIVRAAPNANTTIGLASTTSGNSGFLTSVNISSTAYLKITMNKTDENNYAWEIVGRSNICSFGWTSSTGYKYIRNYSSAATSISMSVVIHGR